MTTTNTVTMILDTEKAIAADLDTLAELKAQQDLLRMEQQEAIPPEMRQILADIELEFGPKHLALAERILELDARIKAAVDSYGDSIKGQRFQAVYSPGRILWDTRRLLQYAKEHPEIMEFGHLGKSSVSIRTMTNGSTPKEPQD